MNLNSIGGYLRRGVRRVGQFGEDLLDDAQPQARRPITGGFAGNEGVPTFDMSRMRQGGQDAQPMQPPPISTQRPQIPPPTRPRTVEQEPSQSPNIIQIGDQTRIPATQFESPMVARNQPTPTVTNPAQTDQQLDSLEGTLGQIQRPTMMNAAPTVQTEQMNAPRRVIMPRDSSADSRSQVAIPALPNRGSEPVPYSDYGAARYDSVMEGVKRAPDGRELTKAEGGGFKRSWKNSLQNAMLGAQRGIAANPQGGLGALAGGALGGGLGATFNSQWGREQVFDAGPGRAMLEDQARRDAQAEQQRKMRMGGLGEREATADVTIKEAQARRAGISDTEAGATTWGTYDKRTGKPIYQRPPSASSQPAPSVHVDGEGFYRNMRTGELILDPATKQPIKAGDKPITFADAEARRSEEEGSPEKIAMDSYEARGGDAYVLSKMPPQMQQILKNPTGDVISQLPSVYQQILKNPPQAGDTEGIELLTKAEQARSQLEQRQQQLYMQAQNEFQQAKQQQIAADRRWTADQAKVNAGKYRTGGATRPGSTGNSGSTPKARLSDLKKYLQ